MRLRNWAATAVGLIVASGLAACGDDVGSAQGPNVALVDDAGQSGGQDTALDTKPECVAAVDCADDGDLCNGVPACLGGHCVVEKTSVVVCDPDANGICAVSTCSQATGACVVSPRNTGAACQDGDPCTDGDHCDAGVCAPGKANLCDCSADADCAAFEDGDLCNGTLFCSFKPFPYRCQVLPISVVVCDENDAACGVAACDPKTGTCGTEPLEDGVPCDDGDLCTVGDTCVGGACAPGGDNTCTCTTTADCAGNEDGDLCNGTLYCNVAADPPVLQRRGRPAGVRAQSNHDRLVSHRR